MHWGCCERSESRKSFQVWSKACFDCEYASDFRIRIKGFLCCNGILCLESQSHRQAAWRTWNTQRNCLAFGKISRNAALSASLSPVTMQSGWRLPKNPDPPSSFCNIWKPVTKIITVICNCLHRITVLLTLSILRSAVLRDLKSSFKLNTNERCDNPVTNAKIYETINSGIERGNELLFVLEFISDFIAIHLFTRGVSSSASGSTDIRMNFDIRICIRICNISCGYRK